MNKLFTKVAALTLGVAMAAGVGVALGAAKASEVKAAEASAYTLDGTIPGSGSSYAGDNEVTQSNLSWIVNGNVTMNPWRIGGKKDNNVTDYVRKVKSASPVSSEDITKVKLTVGAASNITVNHLYLHVGTAAGGSDISDVEMTFAANSTIVFDRPQAVSWANRYFTIVFDVTITQTSNKFVEFKKAEFLYESSNPRGELVISEPEANVFMNGDHFEASYSWTPASGSSATITSATWSSGNEEVLSVANNVFTAVAPGYTTITLDATDSLSEEYKVVSKRIYVTNSYDFAINDEVALISADPKFELASINDGNTKYGVGVAYESNPAGTFALTVEDGSAAGSFAFKHEGLYLTWTSGNTLNVAATKSENTSWFVVNYGDHTLIFNCADSSREIWWNNTNTQERFACYTGKTLETDNFSPATLYKLGGTPAPTLESIAVSGTYKTSYEIGEEFDPAGIVVTATYSDQSQQVVTTGIEYSGFSSETAGQKTITVTYEGKTTTFNVTVNAPAPVTYSVTYKAGDGQGNDHVVSNIEAGSKHALVTFAESEFVAPEGKQFKAWSVDSVEQQPGYEVTVNSNLVITAVYEDIPAPKDWSSDLKLAFAEKLEGVEPPFLGEEFAGIAWDNDEQEFVISVEGDKTGTIESVFAQTEWTADENEYYTPTSHGFAVCDYSYDEQNSETKVEIYFYQTKWYEEKEALFIQHLDGFVPNYHWALDYLSWYEKIGQFAVHADGDATSYFVDGFLNAGLEQIVDPKTQEPVDGQYYIYTTHGTVYGITYVDSNVTYAYLYYVADPIPTSLSINATGAKTEYYVGDELDTAGLVVVVLDENGDPMFNGQNVAQYCEFDADLSAAGQVTVSISIQVTQTITLEGSYQIEVSEAPVPVYTAEDFAHDFLELVSPICSNYDGKKNNKEALRGVWTTMAQRYSTLSNGEKAKVIQASGKAGGSELERAMAFYDYACKKYGLTKFVNDRTPHALVLETTESNSIVPIIAIIAASIAAVTAIGVIIAYKRRKALISK